MRRRRREREKTQRVAFISTYTYRRRTCEEWTGQEILPSLADEGRRYLATPSPIPSLPRHFQPNPSTLSAEKISPGAAAQTATELRGRSAVCGKQAPPKTFSRRRRRGRAKVSLEKFPIFLLPYLPPSFQPAVGIPSISNLSK